MEPMAVNNFFYVFFKQGAGDYFFAADKPIQKYIPVSDRIHNSYYCDG